VRRRDLLAGALAFHLVGCERGSPSTPQHSVSAPPLPPLVSGASNFSYVGSFLLPSSFGQNGATALAIGPNDSANGSKTLYSRNFGTYSGIGAVDIPPDSALYTGTGTIPSSATATVATINAITCAPPTSAAGSLCVGGSNPDTGYIPTQSLDKANMGSGIRLSGCYYDAVNSRTLIGYHCYYPANQSVGGVPRNVVSIAPSILDSSGDLLDLTIDQQIGQNTLDGYPVDGCQCSAAYGPIAPQWQGVLGGTTLSSFGMAAIQETRCSFGPSLFAFTPSNLVLATPLPATMWLMYGNPGFTNQSEAISGFHQNLSANVPPGTEWQYGYRGGAAAFANVPTFPQWGPVDNIFVAFAPANYRSIVIVGVHSGGKAIYGSVGAENSALVGQLVAPTSTYSATATNGSDQLTNVSPIIGAPAVGDHVCQFDSSNFYVPTRGFDPSVESATFTTISAYDATAGTITLKNGTFTGTTGTYTFASNSGDVYGYDPEPDSAGKGFTGYPYTVQMWLYDINDVTTAATPYDTQPYAIVPLPNPPFLPTGYGRHEGDANGAGCFDMSPHVVPGTAEPNRLYIGTGTQGSNAIISVWQFA
jgi:hypothetical protein